MSVHDTEQPRDLQATLRNEPVQARSTARLTALLDAAAAVVDEIGFERLTTAMSRRRLQEYGVRTGHAREKVDAGAAVALLESYLQRLASRRDPPGVR